VERDLAALWRSAGNAERDLAREAGEAVVPAWRRATRGEVRWPATVAIVAMTALQTLVPTRLTLAHEHWVLPGVQFVLGIVLVAANPHRMTRRSAPLRSVALLLIALASLANAWSVGRLVFGLIHGTETENAGALLTTGGNIWLTNVIIFALWYWELDRGGPQRRASGVDPYPDFLFPQMTLPHMADREWEPRFLDYFYVSFTNATAFSPTDTMPLSRSAKTGMLVQSAVSLATAALVVARAVNILK
jgi:uncharacterized membrane protein